MNVLAGTESGPVPASAVDVVAGAGVPSPRRLTSGAVTLWVARKPSTHSDEALLAAFVEFDRAPGAEALQRLFAGVRGHFAMLARGAGWVAGAVDRSRTIPLFVVEPPGEVLLGFHALPLARRAGFGANDLDPDGALALAMAGYTSGAHTLYRAMSQLRPGECVLAQAGRGPLRRRYHLWQPWKPSEADDDQAQSELADLTLRMIEASVRFAGGRQIAVPLSAGYDSRCVVSALKVLGVRDVVTFAYGIPGNFEADASREIAGRLGYPWKFVPLTAGRQSEFFRSELHAQYLRDVDTCTATPFEQDLGPLSELQEQGFVAHDAVLINGNSGDFISGNHILKALCTPPVGLDLAQRRARILDALAGKHFALWDTLQTSERLARIKQGLSEEMDSAGIEFGAPDSDHGVYEHLEFLDRQTKYVINGQRVYEFLGHDWCLPLWDDDYLDFWERMPLRLKAGQRLYRKMLEDKNWGGVWNGIALNAKTLRPSWIVPLRFLGKAVMAPFGQEAWHRIDRRTFAYWYELIGNYGVVPYSDVLLDRRGFRNAISWHTKAYLAGKGLDYDGTVH
jgi:asparagine synthase (glutamine-hydrolysing)